MNRVVWGISISACYALSLLAGCVALDTKAESRDIDSCIAIFETTEEELGLNAETNVATGQRNYAMWLEGMLSDADDPMLRSYGLAAAGAARAAAEKYEKQGSLEPADGEVLITSLLKVQDRCKQVMGILE